METYSNELLIHIKNELLTFDGPDSRHTSTEKIKNIKHILDNIQIIVIDGNIGIGKSTLISSLFKLSKIHFETCCEPADDKWKDELELFYSNPRVYAFRWETFILKSMFVEQIDTLKRIISQKSIEDLLENTHYILQERCIFSNAYCFGRNLYDEGNMTSNEWIQYETDVKKYKDLMMKPNLIFYMKGTPNTCYDRKNAPATGAPCQDTYCSKSQP